MLSWGSISVVMQALLCILLLSLMPYCNSEETLDNIVLANNKLHNQTVRTWLSSHPSTFNLSLAISGVVGFNTFLERMESGLISTNTEERVQEKISEDELTLKKKVWVYDARDSKVASMLVKMGLFEPSCFRPAEEVLIELRVDQRDYFVTIFSRKSTGELIPLRFPYCSTPCSIGRFELLTKKIIPDEWNYRCINQIKDLLLLVIWLVSLVAYLWLLWELFRNRPRNDEQIIPEHNANMDAIIEIIDEHYQ